MFMYLFKVITETISYVNIIREIHSKLTLKLKLKLPGALLLLILNIYHTILYSVSFVKFEELSANWQLRDVALLYINRACMSFVFLFDFYDFYILWYMDLYFIFISMITIFMNA